MCIIVLFKSSIVAFSSQIVFTMYNSKRTERLCIVMIERIPNTRSHLCCRYTRLVYIALLQIRISTRAQWITRLTTDQKIPGSTPGRIAH